MQHDAAEFAQITAHVNAKSREYTALADRVWDMPELRFKESQSAAAHIEALEREGFRITRGIAGIPTAFMAEAGTTGPIIGFLGEFDALAGLSQEAGRAEPAPIQAGGNGHGCGHNLLGAAALLAAVATRDYLASVGQPGIIRYYGCPAEEGGSGKTFMARDGAFDDLDAAFCWHPGSATAIMAGRSLANIQVYFRFTGKTAHASSAPHLGRSALDAVELMNVGVNYLREHMPSDARVHYAITDSGGISPNVVQGRAEVLYLVRSPEVDEMMELFERVKNVAAGAALMTGTEMQFEIDKACSNVLHNTTLEDAMQENMLRLGDPGFDEADLAFAAEIQKSLTPADIATSVRKFGIKARKPNALHGAVIPRNDIHDSLGGSTDVGDVSWITPTAQCWGACYAVGTPFHTWQMVAQGKSPAAHKGMIHAAKIMASTALDVLRDPELRARARAELHERTDGAPYRCPIPNDVLPPPVRAARKEQSA